MRGVIRSQAVVRALDRYLDAEGVGVDEDRAGPELTRGQINVSPGRTRVKTTGIASTASAPPSPARTRV
jgi:hypothetical protein